MLLNDMRDIENFGFSSLTLLTNWFIELLHLDERLKDDTYRVHCIF